MDPQANQQEQIAAAERIIDLVESCDPETGGLTLDALQRIADNAERLAELVLALHEWNRRASR